MSKNIYKDRRDKLGALLPENSVLLLPGADLQYRNADSAFHLGKKVVFIISLVFVSLLH